jgi:hypothetical protein
MSAHTDESPLQNRALTANAEKQKYLKPLRLWPGIVLATLLVLLRFIIPAIASGATLRGVPLAFLAVLGGFVASLAVWVWWLLFSRAPWLERLAALVLTIGGLFVTYRLVDKSIAGGAMGFLLPVLAVPVLSVALVVWAVGSRGFSTVVSLSLRVSQQSKARLGTTQRLPVMCSSLETVRKWLRSSCPLRETEYYPQITPIKSGAGAAGRSSNHWRNHWSNHWSILICYFAESSASHAPGSVPENDR